MTPDDIMEFKLHDKVVVKRDVPEWGLCAGDQGVVVDVYEPDLVEVEFVRASGTTDAVVTLEKEDVRPAG